MTGSGRPSHQRQKMKIAIIVEGLPPKAYGGTEVATYNIAKHLTRRGHDVHVITFIDSGLPAESTERGFYIHLVRAPKMHFLGSVLLCIKTLLVLKKLNPSIIHAQNILSGIFCFWAKMLLRRPYIVWGQGSDVYGAWRFKKPLSRLVLTGADAVIALTGDMKKEMQKICRRDIHVFPIGVDLGKFEGLSKEKARVKLHIGKEVKIITFVGEFRPVKGLRYLVKAMKFIKDKRDDARLMLVGDGEEKGFLEELAKQSGLENHVIFTGWVPNEDVPDFMIASDIFVFSSLSEGGVNMEIMAAGLPIVATNVGGIPEFIRDGENGFLVEARSAEQIAERVGWLLGDEELRRRISENNRAKAKNFSWESIIDRLEQVYAETVANWKDGA